MLMSNFPFRDRSFLYAQAHKIAPTLLLNIDESIKDTHNIGQFHRLMPYFMAVIHKGLAGSGSRPRV